jgi:hypothetical protein
MITTALTPFDRQKTFWPYPLSETCFSIAKNSLTTASLSLYKWGHLAGEVSILYMKIFDSDFR